MEQRLCPACHHKGMSVFAEIEDLPVHCNLLWSSREAALNVPRGNIRLGFCDACGMIYNLSIDPGRMKYTQAYENSLHFSHHFQAYVQELATRLIQKYRLYDKTIIEIGCGKGEFLVMLCEGGQNRGFGFDPSCDGTRADSGAPENITFIRDFYSEDYARYRADFICCRQVLEHIQHPHDFLLQLRRAIGYPCDTVVFFEVPNVLYTLGQPSIWDITYEHCSYFSAPSLARAFVDAGFKILNLYEAYGGQYLCIEASPAHNTSHSPPVPAEILPHLSSLVSGFAEVYRNKLAHWHAALMQLLENGGRNVMWGAGTRGVTFLNILEINNQVKCVVDINPRKNGMYIAGTGHKIYSPEYLRFYNPDAIIVTNAIYKTEIQKLLQDLGLTSKFLCA